MACDTLQGVACGTLQPVRAARGKARGARPRAQPPRQRAPVPLPPCPSVAVGMQSWGGGAFCAQNYKGLYVPIEGCQAVNATTGEITTPPSCYQARCRPAHSVLSPLPPLPFCLWSSPLCSLCAEACRRHCLPTGPPTQLLPA